MNQFTVVKLDKEKKDFLNKYFDTIYSRQENDEFLNNIYKVSFKRDELLDSRYDIKFNNEQS